MYCDETNMEKRSGDFLIYGGIFASDKSVMAISRKIDELRAEYGVPDDFPLKFNPGPKGMDHDKFISLKQSVIESAIHNNAKFLTYLVLHNIAETPDKARRHGIDKLSQHFHVLLKKYEDFGIVFVDRFNDEGNKIEAHLREKFSKGLLGLPHSEQMRLDNIIGFHYSAIGQSNMASLIDIVLGSFRFSLNAHTRSEAGKMDSAIAIMKIISPLFWRPESQDVVPEVSVYFSPKKVKVDKYANQYDNAIKFMTDCGINVSQKIERPSVLDWFSVYGN